ncbi:MAG: 50S ribosomal protein L6, partial [Candidatus Heimdallarchaeota archaeon]|nr:50S ribosomal protein L6 [Candidatus Heimdallarchaeota archaeon]
MVKFSRIQHVLDIPEHTSVKLDGMIVSVKGKLGEITKDFSHTGIEMQHQDTQIILTSYFPKKKHKATLGTVKAHIQNMFDGSNYGYQYKLKIVFSHFPIRVTPELNNNRVKIENLYGGRNPLYAKIIPGVTVKVEDEDVIVEGIDKEIVGQTA